jgi:hypothetical protein
MTDESNGDKSGKDEPFSYADAAHSEADAECYDCLVQDGTGSFGWRKRRRTAEVREYRATVYRLSTKVARAAVDSQRGDAPKNAQQRNARGRRTQRGQTALSVTSNCCRNEASARKCRDLFPLAILQSTVCKTYKLSALVLIGIWNLASASHMQRTQAKGWTLKCLL